MELLEAYDHCMIRFSPFAALLVISAPATAQEIGSLAYQRERLVQAPEASRFYVFKRVFPKTPLDETMWRRLPEGDRANLVRSAFAVQTLRKLAQHPHDRSLVDIINTFDGQNEIDVLNRFERRFFELYGRYPSEFAGVDVTSVHNRIDDDLTIR